MDMLDDQLAGVTGAASGMGVAIAERPIGNEVHVATSVASGADRSGPASGRYDAIVIGANTLGLSLALQVQRLGTGRVRVVDPASSAALAWVAEASGVEVGLDESVVQITTVADGTLSIQTSHATYFAYECIVALPAEPEGFATPPPGVDMPLSPRCSSIDSRRRTTAASSA
jgi:hypothetical protein